jgi:hypothetical protein
MFNEREINMIGKFFKKRLGFFALMLAPFYQTRFYAIADDKISSPGNIETRSSSVLAVYLVRLGCLGMIQLRIKNGSQLFT